MMDQPSKDVSPGTAALYFRSSRGDSRNAVRIIDIGPEWSDPMPLTACIVTPRPDRPSFVCFPIPGKADLLCGLL